MSLGESINIVLNTAERRENILKESSAEQKYILLQNEDLNAKNLDLLVRINLLENSALEHEEEQSRAESRANNLKGLLKNFHEMEKMRKEISKYQRLVIHECRTDVGMFKKHATRHLRYLEVCSILFTTFCYEYYEFIYFLPIFCLVLVMVAFQESTLANLPSLHYEKFDSKRKELEIKVEEIVKAQDYIYEFLDQQ